MKKIIRLFVPLLYLFLSAALAVSDDSLEFLDGFALSCSGDYLFIADEETWDHFILIDPENRVLSGIVLYQEYETRGNLKDIILAAARELVADRNREENAEQIFILPETSPTGFSGYWVYFETGKIQYTLFAADIRQSPGLAVVLLLLTEDIDMPIEDQESLLTDVLNNLSISFLEAAG